MSIILWIVFGLIAGGIASVIDPGDTPGGWIGTIILGILGAVVGGWIGSMLFGTDVTGFNISSMLLAIAGSLLLLFLYRMFRRA